MKLKEEQIKEFQNLYSKNFGKEIGDAEALRLGTQLVFLMAQVYKPIPSKFVKKEEKNP